MRPSCFGTRRALRCIPDWALAGRSAGSACGLRPSVSIESGSIFPAGWLPCSVARERFEPSRNTEGSLKVLQHLHRHLRGLTVWKHPRLHLEYPPPYQPWLNGAFAPCTTLGLPLTKPCVLGLVTRFAAKVTLLSVCILAKGCAEIAW